MSWFRESNLSWAQQFAMRVVQAGKIPRHIAFIMDGNRRFARKLRLQTSSDGHIHGFDKLSEALQWCLDIGIQEVTVYAFSIENFKRGPDEVNTLLELAREKFRKFTEEKDELNRRGICVRMIGNWTLLPADLQKSMAEAMLLTRHNTKAYLNVAFAYTSRDEMTESMRDVLDGVERKELEACDITDDLLRKCMYSGQSSDPDLLVRTSGESRLSDFLLWQSSSSIIYFTKTLWPEFTFWHLLGGIIFYQRHRSHQSVVKQALDKFADGSDDKSLIERLEQMTLNSDHDGDNERYNKAAYDNRVSTFLDKYAERKYNQLMQLSKLNVS